jgi:putative FmdB family regulatory protein
MPIYEYRCGNCGRESEEWQKITDPAEGMCSVCGGKTSRLISHSSFVLKGTGWYVTDYARKNGSSCCTPTKSTGASESASSDAGAASSTTASPSTTSTSDAS